ncbi:MAG: thioredoxin [Candidatus Pacebacteria bacterium]|nr:thioredoxin [Candidatus Paceibacterota bacterium]
MKIITDNDFDALVVKSDKPVVLDVFTTWCPPCKMLAPIIEGLAEVYAEKINFYKMDLDQSPVVGSKFGIDRIPTVIFLKDGEIVSSFIGLRNEKEIREWIDSALQA